MLRIAKVRREPRSPVGAAIRGEQTRARRRFIAPPPSPAEKSTCAMGRLPAAHRARVALRAACSTFAGTDREPWALRRSLPLPQRRTDLLHAESPKWPADRIRAVQILG